MPLLKSQKNRKILESQNFDQILLRKPENTEGVVCENFVNAQY